MEEDTQLVYTAISGRQWIKGEFINSGGMSSVFHARCVDVPGAYVIKIGNLMNEVVVYTRLCKKETLDAHNVECVSEYIDGGVKKETDEQFLILRKYCPSYPAGESIGDRAFIALVRDTLVALRYFHTSEYVHNDVKPDNILYDGNRFVLCDFGVAMKWRREGYKNYSSKRFCGTKIFTGLDMHLEKKGPSPRSDIDSLIFCMMRWCAIKLPWSQLKSLSTIYAFKREFLTDPHPLLAGCPSKVKRDVVCRFIELNRSVAFDALPNYDAMLAELDRRLEDVAPPCCGTCEHLELVRDRLMLSDDRADRAAVKALKYVELWKS